MDEAKPVSNDYLYVFEICLQIVDSILEEIEQACSMKMEKCNVGLSDLDESNQSTIEDEFDKLIYKKNRNNFKNLQFSEATKRERTADIMYK